MEHTYGARYGNIMICPLLCNDIEKLREWRNDSQLSKYLKPMSHISPKMQKEWYMKYLADNSCIFFSVYDLTLKSIVGALAIYNMKENTAEIGKIVIGDSRARGKNIGYIALVMAMKIGNEFFDFQTYLLDCHEDNVPALKTYVKAGFSKTGRHEFINGGYEIEMVIEDKMLHKKNTILDNIYVVANYQILMKI